MSIDPVVRLAALHARDAKTAKDILFGDAGDGDTLQIRHSSDPIHDAVEALYELVEAAICDGSEELTIDTPLAELVIIALKDRKLRAGRPPMTKRQRTLRKATISFARSRSAELRGEGLRPGEADKRAAEEASARGGRYGDVAAPPTILHEMKLGVKK